MKVFAVLASVLVAALPSLSAPTQSPIVGTIQAPSSNAAISPLVSFPFNYQISNWCEEGYNTFKVFLTDGANPPTIADVDDNGDIPSALYNFGQFLKPNFGLPPMGTPPPSSLTVPSTVPKPTSNAFVTVVQLFRGCPGHIPLEIGTTSVEIEMA